MTKSFKGFLRDYPKDAVPEGDFVRDALIDPRMPDATSWIELEDYLGSIFANSRVVKCAEIVWEKFEKSR